MEREEFIPSQRRLRNMRAMSLRLPESFHKQLKELAIQERISINQLATSAIAEKLSALMTIDYLEQRGARADRIQHELALSKVNSVAADKYDEL